MVVSSIKTSAVAIGFKDIPHQEAFQKWANGAGSPCLSPALLTPPLSLPPSKLHCNFPKLSGYSEVLMGRGDNRLPPAGSAATVSGF